MDSIPKLTEDEIASQARSILIDFRIAGAFIGSPSEREQLSSWCINIGDLLYETSGEYPPVRIYPFDLDEAVKEIKKLEDPEKRYKSLLLMIPQIPPENKSKILDEAFNASNLISNEDERSKALLEINEIKKAESIETVPFLVPRQIPPSPADFKGREEELSDIISNFQKGAMITGLRGMGGIGKTALALVIAERIREKFTDGDIFIKLHGTSSNPLSPLDAMAHVIRAYHPTALLPKKEIEMHGLYLSVLAGKRVLLLLDDAYDEKQIELLIPPISCCVLITSRNKFIIPGLKVRDLDVLPPDKSCDLLIDISPRIGDKAHDLAMLCGYLPVALRNAGSAIAERQDLSVIEYEERLKNNKMRLELIEASFSLSFDLLTQKRQRQWCRLSVFPDDFDRDGARAVLKMASDPAYDAISDLVKWSLVNFIRADDPQNGRYRIHDLARIFAESRLDARDEFDARFQHAKYYLKILSQAEKLFKGNGDKILEGLALFDREWENIHGGQNWIASKLSDPKDLTRKKDQISILKMADSYPNEGASIIRLRLYPCERIKWTNSALIASRALKRERDESLNLIHLGTAHAALGQIIEAIKKFEQALKISQVIKDKKIEAECLSYLGLSYEDSD